MDENEINEVSPTESVDVPAVKWHWSFLAMRTLCLGANVANAFRCFLGEVAEDVGSYANYQLEQDERGDFATTTKREIDALFGASED